MDSALFKAVQDAAMPEPFDMPDGSRIVVQNGAVVAQRSAPAKERELQPINVTTLQGLAEYLESQYPDDEGNFVCKVNEVFHVTLWNYSDPENRVLHVNACLSRPMACTMINHFVDIETALIELRECFIPGDMVDCLVEEFSHIKIEDVAQLKDSGLSKTLEVYSRITSKNGATGNGDASIDKLQLSPMRTFPEVEIVPSTFMIRVKRKGNEGAVRLVEMQSNQWEYLQKQAVANYLKGLLPDVPVLV